MLFFPCCFSHLGGYINPFEKKIDHYTAESQIIKSWSSRPVIIGLSLTGVLVGLYYYLCKKDDDSEDLVRQNITVEVRVPRAKVPALIGLDGTIIKDIEQKSSTRIRFSEDNVDNPERICSITGTSECVELAETLIVNTIANKPLIVTYEMFISQKINSILLAEREEVMNTIRSISNAKLSIVYFHNGDKYVDIVGTPEQIECAVYHIEELVKESKDTQEKLEVSHTSRSLQGRVSPRLATCSHPGC
ncbi:tudor and KH domain-containing protein homolog isoform X2 [Microplitis mediator]|nr:tudor and KH domain-containing protein homolog isoform X2 [Microplitis mediator]XP_057326397.1 tudor and KH domain-containing protein homolog isoform X2 [Microplitis mediator]